mgnify:CR=1 FL=1
MATADPNDFTAVPDEVLRPWAQAPELDEQVNQSRIKLGGILQSINPQGGYEGASEIDHVPDVLREFDVKRIYFLGQEHSIYQTTY